MQTIQYEELFDLVRALAGVNSFTAEEGSYIVDFSNRRLKQAYDSSQYWTRYLVVGEERTVDSNNTVSFTETSKSNIGEFLRIHKTKPFDRQSAFEYDFYVTASGANLINTNSTTTSKAFVTYKKEITFIPLMNRDEFEIPLEFFYFIAHAVYADFLRMDGQTEKAIVEERVAEGFLDQELGKLDNIYNNNSIGKRISTYVNRSSR
tara:strand:- start:294 stop:911 length:618 start_codon:yes stop_codon:yes gene_type:complete